MSGRSAALKAQESTGQADAPEGEPPAGAGNAIDDAIDKALKELGLFE